jgi:hypothetical protein
MGFSRKCGNLNLQVVVVQFVVFVSSAGHVSACAAQMLFVCYELSFSVSMLYIFILFLECTVFACNVILFHGILVIS